MPRKSKTISPVPFTIRLAVSSLLVALIVAGSLPVDHRPADAAASCNSITDCTNQINAGRSAVNDLKNQAVSYKDAITRLGSQIGNVQGQISDNQTQQASLEQQIAKAQQDILNEKAVLSELLRTMYVDGQMSTIEELATSNNLSDYVDKQTYRNEVSNKVQDSVAQISQLQAQLTAQKDQVSALLAQQRQQAADLRDDQSEQNNLLGMNQSQQSAYNAQTAANQSKLAQLIAAQRSVNNSSKGGYFFLRFPGAIHGFNGADYPYKNSGFSMSTAPGCNDGDGPDPWGYCTRQCVSYAAWAVQASGRTAPKYYGDAKKWVAAARRNGVQVSDKPQAGDVAISVAGTWGHAMYVESVSGNYINVSQYNQQLNGQYSTQSRKWQ